MSLTFSQSFYHDFYRFSNEVVKSLETTGNISVKLLMYHSLYIVIQTAVKSSIFSSVWNPFPTYGTC